MVGQQLRIEKNAVGDISKVLRHELKAAVEPSVVPNLLNELTSLGFVVAYPKRHIESTYFDSEKLDCFHHSEEGITPRFKVRLRRYPKTNASRYLLEKKFSLSYCRMKTSDEINSQAIENMFRNGYQFQGVKLLSTLCVNYDRLYFLGPDGIRVTIDSNIGYYSPLTKQAALLKDKVVVEVKTLDHTLGLDLLKRLNLRLERFSKYCLGIDVIESKFKSSDY